MRTNPLGFKTVGDFVERAVGDDMHAKRVLSLTNATMGVIHAATLGVTTRGRALAQARGLDPKSAVKQVDRLLSNKGVDAWELFASWVPMVVAKRTELVVALDWTDFDDDDHTTICLYLLTKHGRATPLVWYTVQKSGLKEKLHFDFVIRFRDARDWRFGMGLVHHRLKDCDRRDRLLLISAMAIVLLTLLGAAAESVGLDKTLKVNTVKHRTHSLFNQGVYFYGALPMMKPEKFQVLAQRFGELLLEQRFFREAYGLV